jgi:hypothetical protein
MNVERLMREYERTLLGDNATGGALLASERMLHRPLSTTFPNLGVLLENSVNQNFEVPGIVTVRTNKV